MKLSKLFVLGAMGLVSLTASAAEFTLERTYPAPPGEFTATPVAFQADKHYVLYNTGAAQYFSQGGAWGTKASSCPEQEFANIMYFTKYLINGEWDGKTYIFKIYSTVRSTVYSWHECFFDSDVAMFVDRASQANLYWEVEEQGSNVYRLKIADVNPDRKSEGLYVGCPSGAVADDANVDANREYGTVVPISPKTSENIDWVFYSTDGWDNDVAIYEKSEDLKSLIGLAEEAGVDVSAAVSVYNAETSTLKDFTDAINALGEAMAALSGVDITGSAENPGDATAAITNPNFDDASYDGWLGTAPNMVGSGSHGPANVAEHYNKNFDTYQSLFGLPAGVYGLSAYNFYRGQWEDYVNGTNKNAFLYATAGEDTQKRAFPNPWEAKNGTPMAGQTEFGTTAAEVSHTEGDVTYYIPNDPSAGRLYFEKGFYYNAVAFGVTGGSARIGVKKETAVTNDWSVFDTFGLKYYGNEGAASYTSWLKDNAKYLYANEMMVTESYVSAFEATYENEAPADAAAANAAFEAISKSGELEELKQNIALWGSWLKALDDALEFTTGEYSGLKAASTLDEYIGWDAAEQKDNPTWNNSEIEASIATINQMIEAVKAEKMNSVNVGEDVTNLYIGADDAEFANGKGGWTLEGNCNFGAGGAEAYNQKFDLYKEIESVNAAGVYELQLQGFFRLERDQTAFDMYGRGEQDKTRAWIYMNDVKSYVGCVFDEKVTDGVFENGDNAGGGYWTYEDVNAGSTYWYPNTMTSAVECFNHDMYKVKAYGLVANAGDALRIGIAGDMTGANWMMWDKFKLTYVGYDAATIGAILEEALAAMPSLDDPMGKDVYENALSVKAAAEAAVGGSDGKAMFNALKDLWAIGAQIDASVALFAKLKAAAEGLNELLSSSANEDAINEAGPFVEQLNADIKDHKYNDEDVPALMKQIKGFRYMLRMPAEIVVGTDLTNILEVPEYSNEDGAASSEGWDGTTAAVNAEVMNAEIFNAEEFDHYQEIPGLPAGQYKVTVMAFYRAGNGPADYAALQEGKDSCDNVVLYANNEKVTLHRLAEFADGAHFGEDAWIEVAENSGLYVPNSMSTAAILFDEQDLTNTVIGTVGADGVLRLGLKKEIHITDDWCLFDNWKLEYVGEGAPSIKGDTNGDGKVDVADISQVIAVMAAGGYSAVVDVNADDVVDVADISQVISIMAANARLAKAIEE